MRSRLINSFIPTGMAPGVRHVLLGTVVIVTLAACTSQAAREAELASQAAAQAALEQEAASAAQEQARQLAAEQQRQREVEAAEQARLQAQRDRQAEEAKMRADAEREQREAVERRERDSLAAIAAVAAERQAKLDRIVELEAQIAALREAVRNDENTTVYLTEAVQVAEELLEVLAIEQAKYQNTDAAGNTVEPLAKELVAELQARKDDLVRRAAGQ